MKKKIGSVLKKQPCPITGQEAELGPPMLTLGWILGYVALRINQKILKNPGPIITV